MSHTVCVMCISLCYVYICLGYVNGTDIVRLMHRHGSEDSLSVAARECDKVITAERTPLLVKFSSFSDDLSFFVFYLY